MSGTVAGLGLEALGSPDGTGWVVQMSALDRPGTVTAITNVFSARGVNFDSLVTGSAAGGAAAITVTFSVSASRARQLARTLARLAPVDDVVMRAAADPGVTAAGVVMMPAGAAFRPPDQARVAWSGDALRGQPVLVEGQFLEVRETVAAARAAGALATTVVVLPLRQG